MLQSSGLFEIYKFQNSVGHNHPKVAEAVKKQQEMITHATTMYYHDSQVILAKDIISTLPKEKDWVVHFVCTGSEAIDLAILASRTFTREFDVLSLRNAYHGLQTTAMGLVGLHLRSTEAVA